jgi:hypothetical protein
MRFFIYQGLNIGDIAVRRSLKKGNFLCLKDSENKLNI